MAGDPTTRKVVKRKGPKKKKAAPSKRKRVKKFVLLAVAFVVVYVLGPIIYAYVMGWWTGKGTAFFYP